MMINYSKYFPKKITLAINKIIKSDLGRRMAKGTFWAIFGTAFAKFNVLIAGIVCARILGKDEYGEFGMIRSTITVFVTLGIAGLGLTATKYISEYRKNSPDRISSIYLTTTGFSVVLGIIISSLILILAPVLADKTLNSPFLTNDLRWGGILLFFTILNGIQSGVLNGFEDFKSVALNTFYGSIAEGLLMCLGAYYYGVTGAIIGFGCGYIVIYLCNRHSINNLFRSNNVIINFQNYNIKDLKLLYKFSLPAALSSLMVAPVFWIIKSMLVRDEGYGQLAIYEAADQWKIIILFFPSAISNVVLPILSSIVNDSNGKFWKVLKINILLNGGIAFVLSVAMILFGKYFMSLYGKGFNDPTTLIILSCSTIFTAISQVIGLSISSRGKMWINFIFNMIWSIMVIAFSYIFLNLRWGASGIAYAILYSYIIYAGCQYIYMKNTYNE